MARKKRFQIADDAIDAGYIRKSKVDFPADCESYEDRAAFIEKLRRVRVAELVDDAKRHDLIITQFYDDMDISGRGKYFERRVAFHDLREAALTGRVRRIWARDLSRLFRDFIDQEAWFPEMAALGIDIYLDGKLVTTDPDAVANRRFFGIFHQWRAENDAVRVRKNQVKQLELKQSTVRHKSVWGLRYVNGEGRYEYDHATVYKIIEVWQTFADCQGVANRVAALFNRRLDEGAPDALRTPENAAIWTGLTVLRLINNSLYRREISYNEKTPTGIIKHRCAMPERIPAVIPDELLARVERHLAARKPAPERKAGPLLFTYSGLLKCGYCGGSLYAAVRSPGGDPVWRCIRQSRYKRSCEAHQIGQYRIDVLIGEGLREFVKMLSEDMTPRLDRRRKPKASRVYQDKDSIQSALAAVERKRGKCIDLYINGLIQKDEVERRLAEIDLERDRIQSQSHMQPPDQAMVSFELIPASQRVGLFQAISLLWGLDTGKPLPFDPRKRELAVSLGIRIMAWAIHRTEVTNQTRLKYERMGLTPPAPGGERAVVRLEFPSVGLVGDHAIEVIESLAQYRQTLCRGAFH